MNICYQQFKAPVGHIRIVADDSSLRAIVFSGNWTKFRDKTGDIRCESNAIIKETWSQLQEYFAGERKVFTLPLHISGTGFQEKAWKALLEIPYAETRSYQEQSCMMGSPKAFRATGSANGANPIPIVIPCHRVIGKSGRISGFAGGPEAKEFLLHLEGHSISDRRLPAHSFRHSS